MTDPTERYGVRLARLIVTTQHDGQVVAAVITRSWSGRDEWDRRSVPSTPLGLPPLAPDSVNPALWILGWAAAALFERVGADFAALAVGHPSPPDGGLQGGPNGGGVTGQLELPLGLSPPPP